MEANLEGKHPIFENLALPLPQIEWGKRKKARPVSKSKHAFCKLHPTAGALSLINRRKILLGLGSTTSLALSQKAFAASAALQEAKLRGSLNAVEAGMLPGAFDTQSRVFQDMLNQASDTDQAIYLPAGDYLLGNITLPARVRLAGMKGATRLIFAGGDFFLAAQSSQVIELDGITIDGRSMPLLPDIQALLDIRNCHNFQITNTEITGSPRHANAGARSVANSGRTAAKLGPSNSRAVSGARFR